MLNSNYFDISSDFRPFIHTWSLSIEEQFYFIWPLICLFFINIAKTKNSNFVILLITISLVSILISLLLENSKATFYFTPARIYELLLGAILAIVKFRISNILLLNLLSIMGLLLVTLAAIFINSQMNFPSYLALFPCLGACLLIISQGSLIARFFLENRVLCFFGNISYSLYLINWPLIALSSFFFFNEREIIFKSIIFITSLVLSYINYIFIERKFREKNIQDFLKSLKIISFLLFGFIIFPIMAVIQDGWNWRYSKEEVKVLKLLNQSKIKSNNNYDNYVSKVSIPSSEKRNILVVGDSWAVDVFNSLSLQTPVTNNYNIFYFELDESCFEPLDYNQNTIQKLLGIDYSITSKECKETKNKFKNMWNNVNFEYIFLGNGIRFKNKKDIGPKRIPKMLSFYTDLFPNTKLIYIGLNFLPIDPLISYLILEDKANINKYYNSISKVETDEENSRLESLLNSLNVEYFDTRKMVCNPVKTECDIFNLNKKTLLYDDDNHWSFSGEQYFGSLISKKLFPELY